MKYLKSFKSLNEEIGYEKIDISDLEGDTYNGYTYYYSNSPISFDDIKKDTKIVTSLINRAEANDDIGNYIYIVKTKYPLEIKRDDFSFDIDNPLHNIDNPIKYSGSIENNFITHSKMCHILTKDITKFKLIGGFKKFDNNSPEKLDIIISDETDAFLSSYMTGRILHQKITPIVEKELSQFKLNKPIKLYKGIEEVQLHYHTPKDNNFEVKDVLPFTYPYFSSWSTNFLIAKRFIDDYPSTTPYVVEYIAQPNDILVDTRLLPNQYFMSEQREVILKKDKEYSIKIVWKGDI